MHYKNGRAALPGDKILHLTSGQSGVLHSTTAQSNTCNGRLGEIRNTDPWVTIGECLHIEDIAKADVPDSQGNDAGA